MWKHGDKTIRPGRPWTDSNGTQHPGNWNIWPKAEKDALNIKEVIEDPKPDSRLYFWSMDNGGKVTSTAKPLDDSGSGDSLVLGLKSTMKNEVKDQQGSLLNQTDWAIIRKADKETAIPSNIQTWRDAIRAKATEMENAIDSATDIDAIADLFVSPEVDSIDKFREAAKVAYDSDEANSLSKFKEAAIKTLNITIPTEEEIAAFTPEQKTAYDSDQEKITKEAESKRDVDAQEKITKEAQSKREIEIKKYPFLGNWPELGE